MCVCCVTTLLRVRPPAPNTDQVHIIWGIGASGGCAWLAQWDETLVLALAGMGRLLRAHLRTLRAVLPRFQDGWQELMLVVESSMAGGRHETAVAAVSLLTTVLQVRAGPTAGLIMLRCAA